MKIRLFIVVSCLITLSLITQAQNLKIGYVHVEKIFAQWPETKSAQKELAEYEDRLASRLQAKVKDFQTKLANYQNNGPSMDALTKRDAETELQNLQTQIQQFEANSEQSIAERNVSLLNPLQNKLKETIDQVAKENGYTHILSYGSSLLFTSDKSGDISYKVAQKLGFTLTEEVP
ncbi:hypothetical protein BFP97_06650 [Roseivirga sp. 4D4]|uniref:OmpH family outer membrane protein n=1 Tax=Roseivirga sp. 4D4 TaxID=1889784 RepID=UPI000853ED22|nr:OmpH family outer membrane protein [Roseivirga sp. 4D4]OEK01209.1 hypothetical protein BFP97_06650 [Roseivirga sp. 4D4]